MPAGLGDIMVIVRAQDFASRTLRRVSGELAGMSRQQALAYQGQLVGLQKMQAGAQMEMAMSNKQMLSAVALRNAMNDRIAAMERFNAIQTKMNATTKSGALMPFSRRWSTANIAELKAAEQGLAKFGLTAGSIAATLPRARLAAQNLDNIIAQLPPNIQRAARSMFDLSRASKINTIDLAKAKLALRDVEIAERQLAYQAKMIPVQRMHDFASAISGVGRAMQLWGAVGTGIFVLTANAAANFSRSVTLAATQTRKAGESFVVTARNADLLQRAILQMMTQFPASAEEMSKSAYDIYSSIDVSFGNGIKLLRMFNKMAVAGQVDLATATKAGVAVLSNFDKQLADHNKITSRTTELMNLMFATVRYGFITFQEYAQMLVSVIPAATNAQQSMEDVAGAVAMATRIMPASASRAATALARLLDVFTWTDFQKGMKEFGADITKIGEDGKKQLLPFPDIIERIYAVVKAGKVPLNDIIRLITQVGRGRGLGREATMQARRLLGPLLKQIETYRRVQAETLGDTTEFNQAYAAMAQTMGVRWQVMLNQFKVLILLIGEQALPILLKFGDYVAALIDKWKGLSESTQRSIVQWGTILSIFTLLGGVVLAVVGVLSGLAAGLWGLGVKLGFAKETSEGTLGRLMTLFSTMRGLAGLGTIAIGLTMQFTQQGIDGRIFGALMTAIGAGLLGGAGRGIGVGSIAIGVELFRAGGNWQYLGAFLAAAGFAGLRGGTTWLSGFRKGAGAGLITVGVQLAFQGSGWKTYVGAALLAIGVGLSTGQPLIIPVVFAATMGMQSDPRWEAVTRSKQLSKQLQDAWMMGMPKTAAVQAAWDEVIASGGSTEALQAFNDIGGKAYDAWWRGWLARQKKDDAMQKAVDLYKRKGGRGPIFTMPDSKPAVASAREMVRAAARYTLTTAQAEAILKKINNLQKDIADNAELAATKIAIAFRKGSYEKVTTLIQDFIALSNKKITWANIGDEINKLVESGDVQGAAQILSQFASDQIREAEDAANAWKQYNEDMKQWNESLKRTMKDAATTTINTLHGLYQQITQQNEQLMGDLFQGPWLTSQTFDLAKEWGITPRVEDIIRDMEDQANRFGRIRNLYASALNKKLPKGFLDEIMKMAPDQALQFFQTLATATPEQVQKIITLWNQRKAAIKKASKVDFTDSINAYRKAGIDMATAMLNGFDSVDLDKQFSTWIKKQFPGLINAAVNQAVAQWKKENPVPTKPTGVAGGGGEAPTQVPTGGGKGKTETTPVYRGGSTEAPTVQAPKIPAPVVDYGAYKKAGVVMGNNIVVGFHSVHVARKIQVNFVPEIIRYNANGRSMGTALGKGVIFAWTKQVPLIESELVKVNWNNSIIAFDTAGKRLGNAIILGFKQAKVGRFFRTWINETFPKLIDAAVTEAVTKWKKEHKDEVKPGKAGGTTNNTTNNTSTDNRIIITVPDSVGPHVKTNARYVAWLAKHHIRPNQVQNV